MYDVFIGAAVLVWLAGVPIALRPMQIPLPKGIWPAYAAVPFAFFGARLFNVLLYGAGAARLMKVDLGSFTLYGGLLLGAAAAYLLCVALRLPKRRYFDALAPVCGIGIAVSRIGCMINGCCFGLPAQLPWSVAPPYGGAAHQMQLDSGQIGTFMGLPEPPLPIHPTQAYELIAALLAAGLAVYLIKKRVRDGIPAAAFGLSLSTLRLIIFFFRAFPGASALSLFIRGTVTFGAAILFFGGLLYWLLKYDRRRKLASDAAHDDVLD
ncbi:MAG: prolipoprotein diacylglyceryl transferase family protein [Bacillota bacterium]